MKRGLIFILLASLVALSACRSHNPDENKTRINLDVSGEFAVNYLTGDTAGHRSYYLVLKVSAPDLDPSLVFTNPNYTLGSYWSVAVPNGLDRLFELSIYELQYGQTASGGFDNLTAFVPIASSAQRTFNLLGGQISIPFPMEKAKTGSIGTNQDGRGLIKISLGEREVPLKNCAYKLQAFLIDAMVPTVDMGPATIDMGSASSPGKYLLTNIPLNRSLRLKIVRDETSWSHTTEPFILNSDTTILPVEVTLSGWENLKVTPAEFPVPDGELGFQNTLHTSGGWQAADGNTVRHAFRYAAVALSGSTVDYQVIGAYGSSMGLGIYGANTVDNITVNEKCDITSSTTARAWWYRKPIASSYAGCDPLYRSECDYGIVMPNAIPLNGSTVFVYGSDFDNPSVHGPKNLPEPFLDVFGPSGALTPISGSTTEFEFRAPGKGYGAHHLWVRNNRSNPLFPDFEGYFSTLDVWYSDTVTDKTQVNMDVTGAFSLGSNSYYPVLMVSAPDIVPPLVFINLDYHLGLPWYVSVPNGNNRLFDLTIYELKNGPPTSGGFDNLTAFIPFYTESQRTFNLNGGSLSIPFPMEKGPVGTIGTNPTNGQGLIKISQALAQVPVKNCAYFLQAYLIDPVMPTVELGPALIEMVKSPQPGNYALTNVPLGKTLELKIFRPETDWTGISDPFLPNSVTNIMPVDVLLSGWTNLQVIPAEFPVPDGEVGFMSTMRASGGWQTMDGNTVTHTLIGGGTLPPLGEGFRSSMKAAGPPYADLLVFGSTIDYQVLRSYGTPAALGLYGANTIDNISVMEKCDNSSSATARAWWYRKPMVNYYAGCIFGMCDYYTNAILLSGSTVWVHGSDFDNTMVHGPKTLPEPFLETFDLSGALTPLGGSTYAFDFVAPAKSFGAHHFWVRNNRSNPLFPSFEGFFDTLDVWYSDTAPGW